MHESAFTEPPCNEGPGDLALILETYQCEHKTPGFPASGELAGFAYGLPLAPSPEGGAAS
ncbi:hypothetical protein [Streptomyces sp. MT206]|uniref:hypothetical protein n=1 Tax=Streptomyces sp. MT206 TaxID=3031407 RepID=UPI002FCBB058